MNFSSFFEKATGYEPYPYQKRLAESDSLPSILSIPTGLGKTAGAVLSWVWRRRFGTPEIKAKTPRRLVYCLPMRVLVEQTRDSALVWLEKVGLLAENYDSDKIGVHMLLGGNVEHDWDLYPERDTILIGTQDMLLSRALNRGYAMSRFRWPIQFGLLNNDCLWVMDEIQLMGSGLATTTQLQAFRRIIGTNKPCRSLWMSATLKPEWLDTVDFDNDLDQGSAVELEYSDFEIQQIADRYSAVKTIESAAFFVSKDGKAEAELISKSHISGTLTLVVVNTVKRAINIHNMLSKTKDLSPDLVLIHSRYRPADRRQALSCLCSKPDKEGTIVISTQVIEAGVDISAAILFTDLAPWSSLVQRFGRCNRKGELKEEGGRIVWFDFEMDKQGRWAAPYAPDALIEAREKIIKLKDGGSSNLPQVEGMLANTNVIRKIDVIELFDTTPDLAGADIDVSRFIREADEHGFQIFWREIAKDGPTSNEAAPHREELCSAPLAAGRDFLKKKPLWKWDHLEKEWIRIQSLYPGIVVMASASDGGYDSIIGWNPKSKQVIPIKQKEKSLKRPESYNDDRGVDSPRLSLADHTNRVSKVLAVLLDSFPDLPKAIRDDLLTAARWHDAGKAHEVFQGAIPFIQDDTNDKVVWAKARGMKKYERTGFRHELASALAALSNEKSNLCAYLVAAHHGKVRLSIRSFPHEKPPKDINLRFARGIRDGDILRECDLGDGVIFPETSLSLAYMELGEGEMGPSWLSRMLTLRNDPALGPFRLAFLEALLRSADRIASAGKEVEDV